METFIFSTLFFPHISHRRQFSRDIFDEIMTWFPKESVCPIALFELGEWCTSLKKPIFVGVDENYVRKFDVEQQVVDSLVDLCDLVIENLREK